MVSSGPQSPRLSAVIMPPATVPPLDLRNIMAGLPSTTSTSTSSSPSSTAPMDSSSQQNHHSHSHHHHHQHHHHSHSHQSQARGQQQKKHVCHWTGCTNSFDMVSTLGKHILDHHINCYASSDPLSTTCQWTNCPRMEKAFSTKMKLIMHVRAHTGEKPYACSVPGCSKKFSRMDILNKHLKSHGNSSSFVCVIHGCGKVFSDVSSLNKHKESHPASKPFICPVDGCCKRYTDATGLYKHTEQVHQDNPLVRGQVSAQLNESVAAFKAGVQAGSRRGLSKSSQPLQKLLLQQHFNEFEGEDAAMMSEDESDASAIADSDSELEVAPPRINTSSHPNVNDLSDYDDEDSPKKPSSTMKRVSFSSSSDGDDSARAPAQPYTASVMPPSSTGNTHIVPTMPIMGAVAAITTTSSSSSSSSPASTTTKNGVPVHMQSSFRVNVNQAQAQAPGLRLPSSSSSSSSSTTTSSSAQIFSSPESHEASLKRRSTEIDDTYNPPLVAPEGFSAPLRHSPSLNGSGSGISGGFSYSSFSRPSKQQRLRLSVSEPNLKAFADDDDGHATDDDDRIPSWSQKVRQPQQHQHVPSLSQLHQFHPLPQPQPGKPEQEGALDLLLYFSQHPKQSSSVPTSPTPSPTHLADSLKLPPIASLRLSSPVMATVDPRYNSFTSLPNFPNNQAPPTTPVRAPISPSLSEGGLALPVLPALSSLTNLPALPAMTGGSFTFTKPMFSDRPIKSSKSAPNLSSDSGLSSLSFVVSHPDLLAHTGMSFNAQQQQGGK